jgi:hypothetical protein
LEPPEEDGDFFAGTGGFLEPAENFFMEAAAFLEPTVEDGDFFTRVLVFLAAKAGNVFFFIGMTALLERTEEFLEPAEEDGDFFTGVLVFLAPTSGNAVFIGMAAFLEPAEESGDFFAGLLATSA